MATKLVGICAELLYEPVYLIKESIDLCCIGDDAVEFVIVNSVKTELARLAKSK